MKNIVSVIALQFSSVQNINVLIMKSGLQISGDKDQKQTEMLCTRQELNWDWFVEWATGCEWDHFEWTV